MDKVSINNLKSKINENKYLPEKLKSKLLKVNENSEDIIYLYYPLLFNSIFKINIEKINNISIAGFYYFNSLIILDRILDGDTNKDSWFNNFGNIDILQEESIKILTSLYGTKNTFWELWNLRKKEYQHAFIEENKLSRNNTLFSFSAYKKIAINKSSFGKIAIESLALLSSEKINFLSRLNRLHDYFSISNQLVDDLLDFKEDLEKGQINWLNNELRKRDIQKKNYKKAIYLEGVAQSCLHLSIDYLNKALNLAKTYRLDFWIKILENKKEKINIQLKNIELHIKVAKYKSTHNNNIEPKNKNFHDKIFGKIYGDKGYLGKDLFDKLFVDGIHLVTKLRKNMKKKALEFMDKVYLRKRAIIESVNDVLKNTCQIEHSRHRSFDNFLGNLIAGLTAYSFLDSKPSIKVQRFLPNLGIA